MFKPFALFPVLLLLPLASQAGALPGNAAAGKKLHDANCLSCHTDSVYQRKDRRVTDLAGLSGQITACGHQTNVTPSKEDINNLVKYLNETYYKF